MARRLPFPPLLMLSALAWTGCPSVAPEMPETTKYTLEHTPRFVVAERALQAAVVCTGLQERMLPDGRLEVIANVMNRAEEPLTLRLTCVFQEAAPAPADAAALEQAIELAPHETRAVRFVSAGPHAHRYAIAVHRAP